MTATECPVSLRDVDVFTPTAYDGGFPHETFTALRSSAPVRWTSESLTSEYPAIRAPGPGFWAVSRYQDVGRVLRDPGTFSSHRGGTFIVDSPPEALALQQEMMLNQDAPDHSRLRRIINRAFTPRAVERLRPGIEASTAEILDASANKGHVDLVDDIAAELPLMTLCRLLGVPLSERRLLFDWTNRLTAPASSADLLGALSEMRRYCLEHSAAKRANPTDDVWSTLVTTGLDDGDDARLTDDELAMYWQLLVIAGNETTRNSISGGLLALWDHPAEADRVRTDPHVVATAVEEILRWVSPVNHFRRTATTDVELGGVTIAAGDKVVVYFPSANRDESVFDDPFRFDVGRDPNPHLAFGAGPHFCLGASLARLQLRTMVPEFLRRFPEARATAPVDRVPITFLSGIRSVPVHLTS